jgi:cell division protein ZapA
MGQVVIKISGRDFALTCADGQEGRLRRLAQYVDGKAAEFAKALGQVGEARLILLAALAIADELAEANDALQQARERPADAGPSGNEAANGGRNEPARQAAASSIDKIVERIEAIAARIESP